LTQNPSSNPQDKQGNNEQPLPIINTLQELFPGAIEEVTVFRGETTIVVPVDRLIDIARTLRDNPAMQFNYLVDVTAVDWMGRTPRFDVVYHLYSIPLNHAIRMKVRVDDGQHVPSLTGLWELANWGERETYDMFGIVFDGHPDLRRILLPEDWQDGFPLRKDFPIGGYGIWAAENVPFR